MSVIDAILFFSVIRERIDWPRLAVAGFCIVVWVGFFLALRRAV